jgi:ethanolamine ammonia-lyase large subunit
LPTSKRLWQKLPQKVGRRTGWCGANSAEERVAAQMALAEVPLKVFLNEALVPYEKDEVTRLIIDTHDLSAFSLLVI